MPDPRRQCGTCQACCTVCPVEPLEKPLMQRCEHQCPQGCAIYQDRPEPCAAYQCSWLLGHFDEDQRPDKTGVLFEHTEMRNHDDDATLVVLLGMAFTPDADVRGFLKHTEPGQIVAIAGGVTGDQDKDAVAGHPADVKTWLDYMERARRQGYQRVEDPDQKQSITIIE